ncbi:MAG: biotin--[acetyl-CoA-carboxylase] ligase [bacterium]
MTPTSVPEPFIPRDHNPRRINALLRAAAAPCAGKVHCFGEIVSTNDWLMARSDPHARVCLAELQTAGRGRRGRAWRAPRGSSLLLSLGWRLGDADPAGLSLTAGLATVAALRRLGVEAVGLKWPNDLIAPAAPHHNGGKLGGVLTELRREHCVIGIGLNVRMPSSSWGDGVYGDDARGDDVCADSMYDDNPRADLGSLGYDLDRDHLATAVIIACCDYLPRFCARGFAQFVEEWNGLNVHRDQSASVESAGEAIRGIVRGVDCTGALIIECDGARRRVISGEATLRAAQVTPAQVAR